MRNTRLNTYLTKVLIRRSVIYLYRNYKSGNTYDYVMRNVDYAVDKQLKVLRRAYRINFDTIDISVMQQIHHQVYNVCGNAFSVNIYWAIQDYL